MAKRYKIVSSYGGAYFDVTRLSDGAGMFFQGDDADELRCQLEGCETSEQADEICAQYDDVMKKP